MRKILKLLIFFKKFLKMSMYSLSYHSNIRLHISIIKYYKYFLRLWYYIFAIFAFRWLVFFFLEFTHCYMLSANLALSHWMLLLKVHNDVSIYISPTQYCIVCKRKLKKKKTIKVIFRPLLDFLWIVFYILYFYCDISRCPLTLQRM